MLPILFRDEQLIAIDKPAGWLVHRSNLDRHETRILVQALRDQIGRHVYPAHRLDKGTSGLMLFALDSATAAALAGQFERGEVGKTYQAIVRGWPDEAGTIDHPLTIEHDDYLDGASGVTRVAQTARTEYRRLGILEVPVAIDRYPTSRYAWVELRPQTGRRHQLRRHMKHISHPIIGDATHGKGRHNRWFAEHFTCERLLLASTELRFQHPSTGHPLRLGAPLTGCFAELASRFEAG